LALRRSPPPTFVSAGSGPSATGMATLEANDPRKREAAAAGAHIRQSRPDFGVDFQVKSLYNLYVVPSSLGRGWETPASRLTSTDSSFSLLLSSLELSDTKVNEP